MLLAPQQAFPHKSVGWEKDIFRGLRANSSEGAELKSLSKNLASFQTTAIVYSGAREFAFATC